MGRLICLSLLFISMELVAQKHRPGVLLPDEIELENIDAALPGVLAPHLFEVEPPLVDLSPLMPPVGDQKLQNSCVAWALGYACRSYYNTGGKGKFYSDGKTVDYSKIVSPSFIYNLLNNGDRNVTVKMEDALKLMMDTGSCTYQAMPYHPTSWSTLPKKQQIEEAKEFRIEAYSRLDAFFLEEEIKGQLRAKQPVVASVYDDDAYFNNGFPQKHPLYIPASPYIWKTQPQPGKKGHAIAIVGYNDSLRAFKFMNSYGPQWGDKGFGWISYGIASKAIHVAYVIKPKLRLKPVVDECKIVSLQSKGLEEQKEMRILDSTSIRKVAELNIATGKADSAKGERPELPRINDFEVKLTPIGQVDSDHYDFSVAVKLIDCACDSYQLAVRFFQAETSDINKKGKTLLNHKHGYSLANGQAAIIVEKREFKGEFNDWKRISIPLDKIGLNPGNKIYGGYEPVHTHLIAEAIWYNDNYPIKSLGTMAFEVSH